MGIHEARTFMTGDRVALRLPEGFAVGPDEPMLIDERGGVLTIRHAADAAAGRAQLLAMLDDLEAIGTPASGIQARDPLEFPDRG